MERQEEESRDSHLNIITNNEVPPTFSDNEPPPTFTDNEPPPTFTDNEPPPTFTEKSIITYQKELGIHNNE